jgi:SAM-dependent methyltransferase
MDLLTCPRCRSGLSLASDALACEVCHQVYPVVEGIPCFCDPDPFYDRYSTEHCPFAASPRGLKGIALRVLPFWSWREWRFWRHVIPSCDRLLDLGCGRGRELFLERARETVGYDGSLSFLRDCARRYTAVALGRLGRLPFGSASFDVVTSSHALGHVPPPLKDELIAEIARVLKPGGTTAHVIETDSAHSAVLAAKEDSERYRAQFVDQHGHVGLEPASRVISRFEAHGLRLRHCRLVDALVPSVLNYRIFFDVPGYANLPELRWVRLLSGWTAKSRLVNAAYEVGFGAVHLTLEQWVGRPDFAQFILASFVKSDRSVARGV